MLLLLSALVLPTAALAQPRPRLQRGDVSFQAGWLTVKDHRESRYNRRWADSLFGGVSAGWYWTEHLKTEVEAGSSTEGRLFISQPVRVDGREAWQHVEVRTSRRTVSVGQLYQYGRNAWFHSHVGAGVHLAWERRTERHEPLVGYTPAEPPRLIREAFTDGPATRLTARPFIMTGFKGYVAPRAFVRGDLRLGFRRGLDESILRAGIGFDF